MQMRAEGRKPMDLALLVLVDGDGLLRPRVEDAAVAGREVLDVADVALGEALVLGVDLEVVGQHAGQGRQGREALGVVEGAPRVGDALDLVGDEAAGEHAVGEAVAGVAGDDVRVAFALVEADEADGVGGVEDLARPFVVDGAGLRVAVADPALELGEAPVFLLLADFVVAAADDEVVVLFVTVGEADVVVGVCLVVDEAVFVAASGDADRNAVCTEVFHLGYDTQLLEWDAGCFDGVLACDSMAVQRAHLHFFGGQDTFLFDRSHPGVSVTFEFGLLGEPFHHTVQILGGVEGRLLFVYTNVSLIDLASPALDGIVGSERHCQSQVLRLVQIFLNLLQLFRVLRVRPLVL